MTKKLFGGQHPDTLLSMSKLAQAYYYEGLYQKAEKMGEQVFELQRTVLGETHPDTNNSRRILMAVCYKLGRSDEKLAQQDRKIVEARPGRPSEEEAMNAHNDTLHVFGTNTRTPPTHPLGPRGFSPSRWSGATVLICLTFSTMHELNGY